MFVRIGYVGMVVIYYTHLITWSVFEGVSIYKLPIITTMAFLVAQHHILQPPSSYDNDKNKRKFERKFAFIFLIYTNILVHILQSNI